MITGMVDLPSARFGPKTGEKHKVFLSPPVLMHSFT